MMALEVWPSTVVQRASGPGTRRRAPQGRHPHTPLHRTSRRIIWWGGGEGGAWRWPSHQAKRVTTSHQGVAGVAFGAGKRSTGPNTSAGGTGLEYWTFHPT